MRKILLVKTGTTLPLLRAYKGDFDKWVVKNLPPEWRARVDVVDVASGERLPALSGLAGVILTGSHAMVTDHAAWIEGTAEWLRTAVGACVPTLGICFGHQLLAYSLGGLVGDNPFGLEFGTVVVAPTEAGEKDALLGDFQGPFKAHMCHQQSVLRAPVGAVILARTRREPCAAFSVGGSAWGVQFHPEFDCRTMKVYILTHKRALAAQGQDVSGLFRSCMETGAGHEVFSRFTDVIDGRSRSFREACASSDPLKKCVRAV